MSRLQSIELRRARRRRLAGRRRRRGPGGPGVSAPDADRAVIAESIETLPTGWGETRGGWLLESLGFYGLDAVEEGLLIALVTGEPILLVGRHGTAKTAICCRLGEVLGLDSHAYDAAKALFEDVVGFPSPASLARGEVSYVPTPMSLWEKELILVDELSRAQPQMQNKWLEVIRSHRLMGRALPRLRYVIAAMNPTDYLGAVPLDEALLSRFAVVLRMPDVAEMSEEIAKRVISARSSDDAPLLRDAFIPTPASQVDVRKIRRRLRRRLSVARRQLLGVEWLFGGAVTRYVHELSLHLAERGHAMDARRLGMIRRNLLVALALAAGERRLDRGSGAEGADGTDETDGTEGTEGTEGAEGDTHLAADAFRRYGATFEQISSIVGRTASFSLPFEADGRPGPSADILGTIHRAAYDEAFDGNAGNAGNAGAAGKIGNSGNTENAGEDGEDGENGEDGNAGNAGNAGKNGKLRKHADSAGASRGLTARATRGGHRQLIAYRQRIPDLPLEEHYRVANELLQRAQDAPVERLSGAWENLLELGDIVRSHPTDVPWEVAEHLLDGIAVCFGLAEISADSLVPLCRDLGVDPHRAAPARLARQCLARVGLRSRGDHDDAARIMRRLLQQDEEQ